MAGAENSQPPPDWLDLGPDETVRLRTSPSKNLLLAGVGLGFVLLVVGSAFVGAQGDIATGRLVSAAMLLILVGLVAVPYLMAERREYVLTTARAVDHAGLPWRSSRSLPLDAVAEVTFEQRWWERWIGVGCVRFATDSDEPDLRFAFVEDPTAVLERLPATVAATRAPEPTP